MEAMARSTREAARAWELFLEFFVAQRAQMPSPGAEFELSPVQCHVLHLIEPERPMPMGRLAATLACDASNVTGLVDRLESRKLLERRPAAGDRRVKVLALTPAGVRIRTLLRKRMAAPPDPFARLSADEQRALIRILERLVE